jgi:FkbM family methyltransferase
MAGDASPASAAVGPSALSGNGHVARSMRVQLRPGFSMEVPGDVDAISTYVFLEKEDWFEREGPFIERLARSTTPVALDVGANLGYYALLIATAAGGRSATHAFEPNPITASFLRASVALNGLQSISVVEAAIGAAAGEAWLAAGQRPELDRIDSVAATGTHVQVQSLDEYVKHSAVGPVDFIKLDVEGHELAALEGGRALFEQQSPLLMMEVRDLAGAVQRAPIDWLLARGYQAWQVLPAFDCLVPADIDSIDVFTLNVFFCRQDRASKLASHGLLVAPVEPSDVAIRADLIEAYLRERTLLSRYPAAIASMVSMPEIRHGHYGLALSRYLSAFDGSLTLPERLGLLYSAADIVDQAVRERGSLSRSLSAARIIHAAGRQARALQIAENIWRTTVKGQGAAIDEPFLTLVPEYEVPGYSGPPDAWLAAMAMEAVARWRAHSSIFGGIDADIDPWTWLNARGVDRPEFTRRHALWRMRRGIAVDPAVEAALRSGGAACGLNSATWSELLDAHRRDAQPESGASR